MSSIRRNRTPCTLFGYSRIRKDDTRKGTYIVRVLGTDGEKTAVTYRVAAVLLFGDGASAGVIRKELRRFGRVQERFRDALRRRRVRAGRIRWKADIERNGSMTPLPVVGVPVKSRALNGLDSLLSIVQMPAGVPVATVAINGAKNAALIAVSILALSDGEVAARLDAFRTRQTADVLKAEL